MPNATDTMTAAEFNALHASGGTTGASSERSEQEALVKWAAAKEAERPALRLLFHIPNGGNRTARSGARLKRMGAKAGVPDLCLPVPREDASGELCGALWIEMKAPRNPSGGGRLRQSQRWWRDGLRRAGHAHAVCRSWIEAKDVLVSYLDGCYRPAPLGAAENGAESHESTQKPHSDE